MHDVQDQTFEAITIGMLDRMPADGLDRLAFGVTGLDRDGIVRVHNATEAALCGLSRSRLLGVAYFETIAQCMNNFVVAQRFEDEPELDDIIPYVLTLRMRPTRVRLRLLARPDIALRYVMIER